MRRLSCIFSFLILLSVPVVVWAEVSGIAELRYAEFEQKKDGKTTVDANSFEQQYSLLWEKEGLLRGGRAGQYNLALGGEWTSIDYDVNRQSQDISTLKALYRGDLLVAPGGLPFRLHLYSYDQHDSLAMNDTLLPLQGTLIRPEIATDIENGQHIVTGATLFVGIRNGSYLGQYRDILSQVPRLLLDYKQIYVRDREGDTPQHYRERDLAFVSLNKKDNWFHYRYTDYEDYEDKTGSEDYVEKTYLLGTIDHQEIRRWINMTNWIRVSADASYTTTDRVYRNIANTKRYDVNMFTTARRSNWDGGQFTSYSRVREGQRLSKMIDIPVFANGDLNRNTSWRFQFIGHRDQQEFDSLSAVDSDIKGAYLATQIETFRQARYVLAPMLEVETRDNTDVGDGNAARGSLEFYSNSRYSPKYDLYGSYSLAYFNGEDENNRSSDAWENEGVARVETNLTRLIRVSAEQRIGYTTGSTDASITAHIAPRVNDGLVNTLQDRIERLPGSTLRSTTTLRGEFKTLWRMDNSVELVYDYIDNDRESEDQIIGKHRLEFTHRNFRLSVFNSLTKGKLSVTNSVVSNDVNAVSNSLGDFDLEFDHRTTMRYTPGRAWEAEMRLLFGWQDGDNGDVTETNLRQKINYNFYTVNGMVRRVAIVRQTMEYDRITDILDNTNDRLELSLLSEYYPTRRTLLGGEFRYITQNTNSDLYFYTLNAAVNFEKLQLRFQYEYATGGEIDENRWEIDIRKTF